MQEGGNTNFNGQPNFSQFQNQSPVVSQQPIYLDNGKKSKRPIIIVAIIFIIVVATITSIILLTKKTEEPQPQKTFTQTEIQDSFNKYLNYLFYGRKDSNEKIDVEAFFENYDSDSINIFAETANITDLESISDLYYSFQEKYKKSTLTEAQVYFYFYLGCKTDSVDNILCKNNLGDNYKALYPPYADGDSEIKAILSKIDLSKKALQSILGTYYDVYDINTTITSEAINEK